MTTTREQLGARLRDARSFLYGEELGEIARAVGVPESTWRNYESGVAIPGEVLLRFVEHTGVSTSWLLTGQGPIFRR